MLLELQLEIKECIMLINIYNNMNNLSNMVHLINMTQDIDNVLLKDDHLFEYRDIDIKKFLLRIKN